MKQQSSLTGTGRGMGRLMIIMAWVLLLGMLTWFFGGLLEQRFNPNSNPDGRIGAEGVREVVLARNARGHYVASGRINGQPVTFLLDTGATNVAVPEALAQRLGLEKQSGSFSQTANGVVATWQTHLPQISLGPISMSGVRAVIMPSMDGDDQVLLGMSFLKRLELIQKDGSLTLRQGP